MCTLDLCDGLIAAASVRMKEIILYHQDKEQQ